MPGPKVSSIDFLSPLDSLDPSSGDCMVQVSLEDGGRSTFSVATYDRAEAWMKTSSAQSWWSPPVLFVARLDRETVSAAVAAMAAEMGGYWLRYYNQRKS